MDHRHGFHSYVLAGGTGADDPLLPTSSANDSFVFTDVPGGLWFDPPFVTSYSYLADPGTLFTGVQFPTGFGDNFLLSAPGCLFGTAVGSLTLIDLTAFCGGVGPAQFIVSGLTPAADAGDPLGFPTFLTFNNPTGSFTMTGTSVPEPSTLLLLGTGLAMVGLKRRWQKR